MSMEAAFQALIAARRDEIVVLSAGNASEMWWGLTQDRDSVFYLEASMSLAPMFGAGIALGVPQRDVWVLNGDGALVMNPGTLMVERQMDLPNLKHFVVSNRAYGSTFDAALPNAARNDYPAMARALGVARAAQFETVQDLVAGMEQVRALGHGLFVLEVEALGRKIPAPPIDGPEMKFRFGRWLEAETGVTIFG
ncbi:thiamine pyrophosphate-dependent enzyme [Falsiroseomonas sp. E2-1-a20]|uniref:thiamine pyrophosphate-dependent enzyme n=1 Tax=Falsiroseomonas sp. E2-1-a20 TaxID=3239300 RepID=UPI003F40AFA1